MNKTKKNKNIRDELKALRDIEHQEAILKSHRRRIESYLVKEAGGPQKALLNKHTRQSLAAYVVRRLRRRRFIFFALTTVAAVLIWAGLWTIIEHYIPNPWISLASGFLIILFLRHYSERLF